MVTQGKLTKTEGTWCFWSPEMCKNEPFSGYVADIWAAGICLFVFVTGKLPFYAESPTDLFDMITDQDINYPGSMSSEIKDILCKVLCKDPHARSSIGDLLNHSYCNEAKSNRSKGLHGEHLKNSSRRIIVDQDEIKAAVSSRRQENRAGGQTARRPCSCVCS